MSAHPQAERAGVPGSVAAAPSREPAGAPLPSPHHGGAGTAPTSPHHGSAGTAPTSPPYPPPAALPSRVDTIAGPSPSGDAEHTGDGSRPVRDPRTPASPARGEAEVRAPSPREAGRVDLTPRTDAAAPLTFAPPQHWARDDEESPAERTTRLRPVGARTPARIAAVAACAVLGAGLLGGAVAGSLLAVDDPAAATPDSRFQSARTAWHNVPVDTLFPRTLKGQGAGPGGADRAWTRVAVAPDGPCADALDPLLLKALGPVGCARLLRATYTDATTSSVTTVGMVFTQGDRAATTALRTRFVREKLAERADLMPRAFPVPGTVAAGFGDPQRASWTVRVLKDVPVVVYAVSGFADGRTVTDPQPAPLATADGATTAPAQSGLGHEAKGIADRVERGLRKTVETPTEPPG
ncbi:hypothetical protein ACIO3O_40385 [Streptomyces sp. NPDC087440]|uniref:hypothetical protein n=1 Tax=Streptomyces sp. NPDC087440 TaxID=3365790 RepID=UPI0038061710